jgi:hypothetical protein
MSTAKWIGGKIDVPSGYERTARIFLEWMCISADPKAQIGVMKDSLVVSTVDQLRAAEQTVPQNYDLSTPEFVEFYQKVKAQAVEQIVNILKDNWGKEA